MLYRNFSKYKSVFVSVTGFFVFFLAYLLVNSVIQNSVIKELQYAGVVHDLNDSLVAAENIDDTLQTLNKMHTGGEFDLSTGQRLSFVAIDDYLAPDRGNVRQIIQALKAPDFALTHKKMTTLAAKVDGKVARKLKLTSTLQIVAGLFTIVLYFIVLVPVLVRIGKSDELARESQKETEGILSTVSEGLFLIDADYHVGVQQSNSLREMFKRERDLEGNFLDFIGQYVTPNTVQIAKDYMHLLFGDRVKERLVEDLNPLKAVEINITRRDGSYENRYLDFKFKRIFIDGKLSHLLGSVTDITRQIELERKLDETRDQQEAQLDVLRSILHADTGQLRLFFEQAEAALTHINQLFESDSQHDLALRNNLVKIARDTHRIKGDAAVLGLATFERLAHEFEDEVGRVRSSSKKISGKELLKVISKLRELFAELAMMRSLVDNFSQSFGNLAVQDNSFASMEKQQNPVTKRVAVMTVEESLSALVQTVAERNNRQARLKFDGLALSSISPHLVAPLKDIAVQLLRNSVVHGAETPGQREQAGKTPWLNIDVSVVETDSNYEFIVRDDGHGLNPKNIIERAVALNIIKPAVAAKLDAKRAVALLFMPGYSNHDIADLDSGRGVGLDVVKDLVKQQQGRVGVRYEQGVYSQFRIVFPKTACAAQAHRSN